MTKKINSIIITLTDDPTEQYCSFRMVADPPGSEEFGEGDEMQPCLYVAAKIFDYLYSGAIGEAHERGAPKPPEGDISNVIQFSGLRALKDK